MMPVLVPKPVFGLRDGFRQILDGGMLKRDHGILLNHQVFDKHLV
jgi:hypothetical protein